MPGLAARLPIVFSEGVAKGRIDLNTFVRLIATNPAKLFGLYPRKGTIAPGSDADLVLWDPGKRVTITNALMQHAIDYTPYEGLEVTGWPVATVKGGRVAMRDGKVQAEPGSGEVPAARAYEMIKPTGRTARRLRRHSLHSIGLCRDHRRIAAPAHLQSSVPARALGAGAVGALALGALALGALAIGALAVGRLAIGRLAIWSRNRAQPACPAAHRGRTEDRPHHPRLITERSRGTIRVRAFAPAGRPALGGWPPLW